MKHITVEEFKHLVETEHGNTAFDFINVCTPEEYAAQHVEGVRSVPLDEIDTHIDEFKGKQAVYIHCRSGNRGRIAMARLKELGVEAELINVEGGLLAWDQAGYKTNSHK
ncbi:MAG: rhodanese-like domain-containing protein [Patescibacteria group bacterium UBA2163]